MIEQKKEEFEQFLISQDETIKNALEHLNRVRGQALYATSAGKVVGSITDGDIRRGLLASVGVEKQISLIMNKNFKFMEADKFDYPAANKLLKQFNLNSIPVLDSESRLIAIYRKEEPKYSHKETVVFLLAGGMGARLGDITQKIPKPMVPVGNKPILEHIIQQFISQGFSEFIVSLNYKAEIIEDYFKNGDHLECNISYVKESSRLGTAGPLSLIKQNITKPLIVMNGDLMVNIDFAQILNFHSIQKHKMTVVAKTHEIEIPYGVLETEDGYLRAFNEKPLYSFLVNAGIYIIEPELLSSIPAGQYYDMSTFLNELLSRKTDIGCYPLTESWIDIGREADLSKARELFLKHEK